MKTKNNKIVALIGMVTLITIGTIMIISALTTPYSLSGHLYDKASTAIVGANITFTNQRTSEVIYCDSTSGGEYQQDAANFASGYENGDNITYHVIYDGAGGYTNDTYLNDTWALIDTSGGGTLLNITLDQAPTEPTSPTNLGMNLIDHTPAISWTKGTDADSGDTVTTYVYVGTGASPTTEEGNNTGTTIDLGSTVTLTDGNTYYYRLRSYDGERWSNYTADDTFRMNSVPMTSSVDIQGAQEIQHITDHTPDITWSYNDPETDTQTKYNVTVWTGTGGTGTLMGNSGDVVSAGTTWTYSGTALVDGTTYYARVYTNDSYEWGAWNETSFRMNSKPTISSVQITPGTTNTTTALTGAGTYADTEGDTESGTTYKWFKNDVELGETTTSLADTNFVKNDQIIFQYTPNDGYEVGTAVNSSTTTIGDTIATLDSIGAKNVNDKVQVNVDVNGTDQDVTDGVDTFVFSCNRTDLFAFDTATGIGTWTPFYNQSGVYYVDFGANDGTTSNNETITVTITDVTFGTTGLSTTAYNILSHVGKENQANSSAEQFGIDIGSVDYVTKYNGTFTTHSMGFETNNFTVEHGLGYYVYINSSGSSTYTRSVIDDAPYTTTLTASEWRLIGWTNTTDTNAEGLGSSMGSNCTYTATLNADGTTFTTHTIGFVSYNHDIIKGKGYYAFVNALTDWERLT